MRLNHAPPSISVCILTCNRDQLLVKLLTHLLPQLSPADEVIVLDTGAAQATRAAVEQAGGGIVRYHQLKMPQFNFAAARNELLRLATKDGVAFTDDDAVPLPGWLEQVRQQLQRHDAVGGATVANANMPDWWDPEINWTVGLSPPGTILGKPGYYPDTCNMAAHREIWQAHPFDEVTRGERELYVTGREDADWWMQRRLQGADVVVNWRQAVSHLVHPDRLTIPYVRRRAYNDGVASWVRRPTRKAATDIPWDLAHIAAIVAGKTLRRPFDLQHRLADSIWMHRQWGKFSAVWNAPIALRPRRREQLRQLANASLFQLKIRAGKCAFKSSKLLRRRPPFPTDLPRQIFVSADCFLGDSVLLRRHVKSLADTFPNSRVLVSCKYPALFTDLAANIQPLPTADAAAQVRSGHFRPDAAIVPYFPFGDYRLWRDHLSPIGATFDCDVGFAGRRDYEFARLRVPKSMELHEHENLARLFRLWPLTAAAPPPPSVPSSALDELTAQLQKPGISGNYIAVQVGSGHPSKDWSADQWTRFLQLFVPAAGLPVIFIGADTWREPAAAIIQSLGTSDPEMPPMANLCGSTFEVLMAAVSRASLVIGGCSGPKHLAMAFRVPTFTLYAASEPDRWGASEDHDLHGYVNALPQKLSGMELQATDERDRINLLKPENVAPLALSHWHALLKLPD